MNAKTTMPPWGDLLNKTMLLDAAGIPIPEETKSIMLSMARENPECVANFYWYPFARTCGFLMDDAELMQKVIASFPEACHDASIRLKKDEIFMLRIVADAATRFWKTDREHRLNAAMALRLTLEITMCHLSGDDINATLVYLSERLWGQKHRYEISLEQWIHPWPDGIWRSCLDFLDNENPADDTFPLYLCLKQLHLEKP